MKRLLIILMVAITAMLSLPSTSTAQENEPQKQVLVATLPNVHRLENPATIRNTWKYAKAFPEDIDFYNHIEWTQQAFQKPIVGVVKDSMDAHRITVVIYNGAKYDAETQTLDVMEMLKMPLGSKVDLCLDIIELNPDRPELINNPRPTKGVYYGAEFSILLPDSVYSWDVTGGYFGGFTEYGYFHIDPIYFALASPSPAVNDTQFNGYQPHLNGNVANMSFGNINQGTYLWAIVPKQHTKIAIFDSGIDTLHRDFAIGMIDTASCYNVPLGNKNIKDSNGHGTRVGSLMSGRANNLYGIAGTNQGDTFVVYKVWAGGTMSGPGSYVITATNYAHNCGVKNKNYSLGGTTYDPTFATAIANGYSSYNSWTYSGAGNSGSFSNSVYPACFPKGHPVVGRTISGAAWSGSTTTDSAFAGAQAQNVMSAVYNTPNVCSGSGINGTSFAAPIVAGSCSQVRNYFPDKGYSETKSIMISMLNGGGSHSVSNGYGTMVDSLVLKTLRKFYVDDDTLNTATCVTGKKRIGGLQTRFKWVDSGFIASSAPLIFNAMTTGDTVNFNLVPAGTYFVKRWVKSMPEIPGYSTPWYDTITIVIYHTGTNGTTPSTIISTGSTSVCSNASFTVSVTGGNTGSVTKTWYRNGTSVGTGSSYVQPSNLTPGNYTYYTVADLNTTTSCWSKAKDTSNSIVVTVSAPVTPSVSVSPSATTICAGTSVTFTATPTNGGTPSYQWKVNGSNVGTNSNTYSSSTLANGDVVTVVMTSSLGCVTSATATSTGITMTVTTPVSPSVSIGATATTICAGTSVTFTATPTNGGTPSYQWKVNGSNVGTNSTTYISTTLANGDVVTCVLTTSLTCVTSSTATSNGITMSVTTPVTPSVSIGATATTICSGTSVTFTATPTNGGTPNYQWKVNSTNVGTNSNTYASSTLTNGDVVTCVMTTSLTCVTSTTATSNGITMTVTSPVTPSVTIGATPSGVICSGTSVTFTATPTNGGTPSYQWKKNAANVGTNSSTYIDGALANGDIITCVLTTSLTCVTSTTATSNGITMSVTTSVTPTITISSNPTGPICAGSSVTFTAAITNGGTSPSYQWKKNGTNVGTNNSIFTSTTLANNDVITCVLTSNETCVTSATATSTSITMAVNPLLAPPTITVANSQPYPDQTNWKVDYTFGPFPGPYDVYRKLGGVGVLQTITPGNTWTHIMDTAADSIYVVYHLTGCYTVDSSVSNTLRVSSPVSVAALPTLPSQPNIYPNPASSLVFIEGLPANCKIQLYSMEGKAVYTEYTSKDMKVQIDLSGLPSALYGVHVISPEGATKMYKVTKQ